MAPSGIEPATFRFVAHSHRVPPDSYVTYVKAPFDIMKSSVAGMLRFDMMATVIVHMLVKVCMEANRKVALRKLTPLLRTYHVVSRDVK